MRSKLKLSESARQMLRKMPGQVIPALFKGVQQFMLLVEGRVKGHYLSGGALNRVTGRLRNSVTSEAKIDGNKVVGKIGTNVVYGRLWELGYKGPMQVMAHARTIRQAFGKPIDPVTIRVSAHTRNVDIKARPFMRPALDDEMDTGLRIITNRIEEAFKGV